MGPCLDLIFMVAVQADIQLHDPWLIDHQCSTTMQSFDCKMSFKGPSRLHDFFFCHFRPFSVLVLHSTDTHIQGLSLALALSINNKQQFSSPANNTYSPLTLVNISYINHIFIFRCSSSLSNPVLGFVPSSHFIDS